jgi:tetratricopeptide (TPR) repeat protein
MPRSLIGVVRAYLVGTHGLAAAAVLPTVPEVPDAPWVRLQSGDLELWTDASEVEARALVDGLLRFRAAIGALVPLRVEETPPLTLYVFKDEASFRPFLPLYRGRFQPVAGFAQVGEEGAFGALALTAEGGPRRAAYHEYAHLLLSRAVPPAPPWLSEGLAEFWSAWRAEGTRLVVGEAQRDHVALLRHGPLLPLEDLLRVDYASPLYNESSRSGMLYAQSWALVHYLLLGRGATPSDGHDALHALARDTGNPVTAFRTLTGEELAVTDMRLREYIARGSHPEWPVDGTPAAAPADVRRDAPSRAEIHGRLGQLLLARGRAAAAEEYLERSLRFDPAFVPSHLALAALRAQQLQFRAAQAHVARAKALAPLDPQVLYRYADLLVKEGLHLGKPLTDAEQAAAVAALETAVRRAPWFSEAVELLVYLREDDPRAGPELLATLHRAIARSPGRAQLYLTVARLHVRRDEVPAARAALRHALESREEGTRVLAALSWKRLDEYEATTAEVQGTLLRVGCLRGGALEFLVDADGRFFRLHAPSPREVLLYRSTREPLERTLLCGEQAATPVVARYRPESGLPDAGVYGRVLAMTFP